MNITKSKLKQIIKEELQRLREDIEMSGLASQLLKCIKEFPLSAWGDLKALVAAVTNSDWVEVLRLATLLAEHSPASCADALSTLIEKAKRLIP